MRSQRELGQLQYFDPEAFDVKIDPNPARNEVDVKYIVSEKSSDQIQLQGGWGGGRVVGSLGLTFNNFSSRNIFNGSKWRPLPSGDGQRLSLTARSNGAYYQNYMMSFTEPWLGGKKPTSLSISLSKSIIIPVTITNELILNPVKSDIPNKIAIILGKVATVANKKEPMNVSRSITFFKKKAV